MSAHAKGAVLLATLDYLRATHGETLLDEVLAGFDADTRAALIATSATDEIPLHRLRALWHAADRSLGTTDPDWMEKAGAHSIVSQGVQMYGGIVRKSTPLAFLTQPVSLFRLFYQPGEMEVVEHGDGRAVLRLVGFADAEPLFCRRQTGGLRRAVELAGGRDAITRHVRCVADGDCFCEWELLWG